MTGVAAPAGQLDHCPEVYDFLTFLKEPESSLEGYCRAGCNTYTPKAVLQQYFNKKRGSLQRLLDLTLAGERHVPTEDTIANEYISVFATLLSIGRPQFLNRFIEHGFCDSRLPYLTEDEYFPPATDGTSFFDRFWKAQWRFCPYRFHRDGVSHHVRPQHILPLRERKELCRSPPATVYKVELHEAYDPFQTMSRAATGKTNSHTYVFKQFNGAHAQEAYEKELQAFLYLYRTGGVLGDTIIGFYGSFRHGDSSTIILEYADRGTLEEFLRDIPSPEEGEDIIKLWQALLELPRALHTIHNIPTTQLSLPAEDAKHSILRGWHQDIKPSNILVMSGDSGTEYDCRFCIADLGTAHFTRVGALGLDVQAVDSGGTRAYGAPECYRFDHKIEQSPLVKQTVDIWSLGCVFSEFAVWTVSGPEPLKRYRIERQQETEMLNIEDTACFHNKISPLACVHKWNRRAFEHKRSSDHVTRRVLTQMVGEMLFEDSAHRPTASQLVRKAKGIVDEAITALNRQRQGSFGTITPPPWAYTRHAPAARWTPRETFEEEPEASGSTAFPENLQHALYNVAVEGLPPTVLTSSPPKIATDPVSPARWNDQSGSAFQQTPSRPKSNQEARDDISEGANNACFRTSSRNGISAARPDGFAREERHISKTRDLADDLSMHMVGTANGRSTRTSVSINRNKHDSADSYQSAPLVQPWTPPTPSTRHKARLSKCYLLLADLHNHYHKKKRNESIAPLPDEHCLDPLAAPKRDFVFLLDDSASMWKHKDKVRDAVRSLAWLLKQYDDDGIDMHFMRHPKKYHARAGHSKDLQEPLYRCMTNAQGTSDGKNRLSTLLDDYTTRYKNRAHSAGGSRLSLFQPGLKEVKPMIIYVITDGNWEPGSDPAKQIKLTAEELQRARAPENQLGIQFISVYPEEENLARLTHLDSGLNLERDMVDTEPIDGNVFKMLLGPISRMWDGD